MPIEITLCIVYSILIKQVTEQSGAHALLFQKTDKKSSKEKGDSEMKIVGIEKKTYTKKETRETIPAIKFYLEGVEGKRDNLEGVMTESVFISSKWDCYESCLKFKLGDDVRVSYNRWGDVDSLYPTGK